MSALSDSERLQLIREIYQVVADNTTSFELDDMVGPDLAYLLGAMACETGITFEKDRAILGVLQNRLPPIHAVWSFIEIEEEE